LAKQLKQANCVFFGLFWAVDCWDGAKGEPVVYHGFTLTSKIELHDILTDAILPYAFSASDYPLILSLEVHCSQEQQARIAHQLTSVLGDLLYVEPAEGLAQLPSPHQLKNKIIVKAKKLRRRVEDSADAVPQIVESSASEDESGDEEDLRDDPHQAQLKTVIFNLIPAELLHFNYLYRPKSPLSATFPT